VVIDIVGFDSLSIKILHLSQSLKAMSAHPTPPKRILLVDDDPAIQMLYTKVLSAAGFAIRVAHNGREALASIPEFRPDVIILDLIMPEQEGIETILKLQQEQGAPPVIAISGAIGANEYLNVANLLGARRTLMKPITPDQLLSTVRAVLASEAKPA
jgi:two-component system chemotaxis response regulator CheY